MGSFKFIPKKILLLGSGELGKELVVEAKRLGLDKIDSIISARLAQLGQQALVGEIIDIDNVEISEVNNFFDTNKSQYIEPETISFSHIFFDTD